MKKMAAVFTQMHNKSGPEYEHWQQQMEAMVDRFLAGVEGGKE